MTLSPEDQIFPDIEALQQRIAGNLSNLKDRPAMKYALESLPELIGADDFADLCLALGMDYLGTPTGSDLVATVRGAVMQRERKVARREMAPGFKALLDSDVKAAAAYEAPSSVEERLR